MTASDIHPDLHAQSPPPVLDYGRPDPGRPWVETLLPVSLSVPSTLCWLILLVQVVSGLLFPLIDRTIGGAWVAGLWAFAVLCSAASIPLWWRHDRTWQLQYCAICNGLFVLMSAPICCVVLMMLILRPFMS